MRNKKNFIIFVIVMSFIGALNALYVFHYKEKWFDATQHPKIDIKNITKIEIGDGVWKWKNEGWERSNDTKLIITNKRQIIQFCEAMLKSHSKYIDNIRPNNWLEIDFYYDNGEEGEMSVVLKENEYEGIFFEYQNNTFEGEKLSEALRSIYTNQ